MSGNICQKLLWRWWSPSVRDIVHFKNMPFSRKFSTSMNFQMCWGRRQCLHSGISSVCSLVHLTFLAGVFQFSKWFQSTFQVLLLARHPKLYINLKCSSISFKFVKELIYDPVRQCALEFQLLPPRTFLSLAHSRSQME